MDCNEIRDMISLYIDGELDSDDKILFEKHINSCKKCRNELEEYKNLIEVLRNMSTDEPPKGYCKRLHERLLKVKNEKRTHLIKGIMRYGSIAAMLILVFTVIYTASNHNFQRSSSESQKNSMNEYDMASTGAPAESKMAETSDAGLGDMKFKQASGGGSGEEALYSAMENVEDSNNYGIMADYTNADEREMKIIKSADFTAQTESYDVFVEGLNNEIELLGGYLEQNNTDVISSNENRQLKYGNLTIRVPQDRFYELIDYIGKSCNINHKSITETDVTKEYYEKDNQVKNLELQENQLRELLSKAVTVQDTLSIENELRRIRTEIDSLNMSLTDIDYRSSMSTISLSIEEVSKANLNLSSGDSFLEKARDGFVNTVNSIYLIAENIIIWLISMSPILIPVVIILISVFMIKRKK